MSHETAGHQLSHTPIGPRAFSEDTGEAHTSPRRRRTAQHGISFSHCQTGKPQRHIRTCHLKGNRTARVIVYFSERKDCAQCRRLRVHFRRRRSASGVSPGDVNTQGCPRSAPPRSPFLPCRGPQRDGWCLDGRWTARPPSCPGCARHDSEGQAASASAASRGPCRRPAPRGSSGTPRRIDSQTNPVSDQCFSLVSDFLSFLKGGSRRSVSPRRWSTSCLEIAGLVGPSRT